MPQDTPGPARAGPDHFDIASLVDGLAPVRRLRMRTGMVLVLAATIAALIAVAMTMGLRDDLASGTPHRMFFMRAAALMVLGVTAAAAALSTATPAVGKKADIAWKWALAAAALFPLGALGIWASAPMQTMANAQVVLDPEYGMECLRTSALCGVGVAIVMVLWVRRGAPSSPERAAWLIGLASGALGAAAYGVHCSENVLIYIGTWYSLAVALCAVAGRVLLPPLLRW